MPIISSEMFDFLNQTEFRLLSVAALSSVVCALSN